MRTIDADALMNDICESLNQMTNIGIAVDGEWLWEKLNDALDNAPTIEPQRIRGKWIPHHDEVMLFDGISIGGVSCSECGWKTYNKMHLLFGCPYKYCPKCGADMREE